MFAAGKITYVSCYFIPVYVGMRDAMSPALKRRTHGKACFNFAVVDPPLFAKLADVTRKGYDQWTARGLVE